MKSGSEANMHVKPLSSSTRVLWTSASRLYAQCVFKLQRLQCCSLWRGVLVADASILGGAIPNTELSSA